MMEEIVKLHIFDLEEQHREVLKLYAETRGKCSWQYTTHELRRMLEERGQRDNHALFLDCLKATYAVLAGTYNLNVPPPELR